MIALVVSKIAELGIKVIHIPGGCTGLCQPLDVGVNKPFKACIHWQWEEWMTDMIDMTNEVCNATRMEVVERATATYWDMAVNSKKMLQNAWRMMEYNWFPGGLALTTATMMATMMTTTKTTMMVAT